MTRYIVKAYRDGEWLDAGGYDVIDRAIEDADAFARNNPSFQRVEVVVVEDGVLAYTAKD